MALQKIGASIVLEGEKQYRDALKSIASEQKVLRSEMNLNKTAYKDNENTVEALAKKYEILTKQVDSQKEKVAVYEKALAKAQEQQSKAAQNVENYSKELEEAEKNLEEMKSSGDASNETIKEQEKVVDDLKVKLQQSQSEYDKNTVSVNNWKTGLNQAQSQLITMNQDLTRTGEYLKEAEQSTDGTAHSMEDLDDAVKDTEKSLSVFGDVLKANLTSEAIIAGIKAVANGIRDISAAAFESGTEFEAAMSKVQSVSGATGETLQALNDKAKEMGATTMFSASQSAEALNYMAMAGWNSQQMIAGLEGVMDLAAASGTDLATASDIITDDLTAFGMSAQEAGHMADVFAAASSNANTNVEMMGATFSKVGPIAGSMGYSLEDVAIATGLLANSSIKAEQAGTQMKTMLANLANPSKAQREAMEALNISLTDAQGNMKTFREVMQNLRTSFDGLSEAEKTQYAATLAGKEAMAGMLVLVNSSDEDFNKLANAIDNSNGAAKQMSNTMQDNLKGDITIMKSALEGLQIAFYDCFDDTAREAVQGATGVINELQESVANGDIRVSLERMSTSFADFSKKVLEFTKDALPKIIDGATWLMDHADMIASILGGIATSFIAIKVEGLAMSVVNNVMSIFATKTVEATAAQEGLNTAMAANPIGLVVTAIGFATGALNTYLQTQNAALDAQNEYTSAITDEQKAVLDANKARGEAQKAYANNETATKNLITRLKELRQDTVLTREEQAEMAQIVGQLNQAYPELNLEITENGNNLNMTNEAIEKNCELMQNQLNIQNAMADLSDISKEQYESQVRMAPLIKEQEQATQEYLEAKKALKEADDADLATQIALYDAYEQKSHALTDINDQVAAEEKIQRDLNEQYQVATDYINENKEAYEANEEAVESLETAIVNYHGKAVTLTGEEASAIHGLREAYEEARIAAQDSLDKQIGLFDELTLKSDLSVEQMKNNLNSQTEVMTTYSEDMLKAAQLVEDGLMDEGLLGEIKDMGIQGAGYLHELVTSAEEDGAKFNEVMAAWSDMEEAKNTLAETMADIETNFSEAQDAIVEKSQETQNTISENAEHWKQNHVDLWADTYSDVKTAIDDSKSDIETSSKKVAQGAIDKSKDVLEIDENGDSGKGKEIGGSYGGSVATGILDSEDDILSAIDSIFDAADARAKERASNLDRIMGEAFGG